MVDTDTNGVLYTSMFSDHSPWYVIHCKVGREKYTSEILRSNLGLTAFLPVKKIWNKGEMRHIPLFPGYFFLQADLQRTALSHIHRSPGVLHLLTSGGSPQKVPFDLIETLMTEISRLNDNSIVPFQPGDNVYIVDGPLHNLEAVFIGPTTPRKRVQILLNLLGRLTKTEVAVSALKKNTEECKIVNTHFDKKRYTRGKGRKTYNHVKRIK
ncbi:transcription termination/antitermination protein NusG [Dictyobacter formicarum]|uniref:NusG-like N-terminal domain-containing protein n=1 Tax=Dictyobacter formicarum TaxID=2778368 RepID=A0ABQ3VAL0_9CHLR|nr:transcription termination/antitermination NusG family protein [Dictyobacter formicarum]GHO82458.1 hypothetical protein KSZ_04640 [Dictyobacter formicarum]